LRADELFGALLWRGVGEREVTEVDHREEERGPGGHRARPGDRVAAEAAGEEPDGTLLPLRTVGAGGIENRVGRRRLPQRPLPPLCSPFAVRVTVGRGGRRQHARARGSARGSGSECWYK